MSNRIREKLNNLPDITQLINGRDGIPNQGNPGAHDENRFTKQPHRENEIKTTV